VANVDLRTIGFTITEVFLDMHIRGKHWVRETEQSEWKKCPRTPCPGFRCNFTAENSTPFPSF